MATIRRRQLLVATGAQSSSVVLYSRTSGNRSERSSRTICQMARIYSKNRYRALVGLAEKNLEVSKM